MEFQAVLAQRRNVRDFIGHQFAGCPESKPQASHHSLDVAVFREQRC